MTDPDALAARLRPLLERAADIRAWFISPVASEGSGEPPTLRYDIVQRLGARETRPELSIIIPTYHRPALLVEAVGSTRGLRCAYEVVVVNDGESADLNPMLEQCAGSREPITVVQHDRNLGLAAARNTGAAVARGEWLLMLDDDDTLVPGGVGALLAAGREATRVGLVFGDHLRQLYEGDQPAARLHLPTLGARFADLPVENPIMCGSFIARRSRFWHLRGYDESLPVHEDYNLHIRMLASTPFRHVPLASMVYHCREVLPRLNHRRLFWFATAALNHALYSSLFGRQQEEAVLAAQREAHYAHLQRALREGSAAEYASAVVRAWWDILESRGLHVARSHEAALCSRMCPGLL